MTEEIHAPGRVEQERDAFRIAAVTSQNNELVLYRRLLPIVDAENDRLRARVAALEGELEKHREEGEGEA